MFKFFRQQIVVSLLLFALSTTTAIAIELQAHIEPTHVTLGDTVTLIVQLINDSNQNITITSEPDVNALQTNFTVYGPSTSHYTQSINGVNTQQISWQYNLEPLHDGTFTIPAMKVATSQGEFQSQPIVMTVGKSNTGGATPHLTASVSNLQPYLHQPIYYTLRLYHLGNISNLEAVLPEDGILMETLPDSVKKSTAVVDGQAMDVLEVTYLLTPLRSGEIQLTPAKIKGAKVERNNRRQHSDIDFFLGYSNSRPFTLSSDILTLQVKAPEAQPWLPAQNLTLTEKWESDTTQEVTAGTPIIRTLTVTAENVGGQPLSSLENIMQDNVNFKVRAPKPDSKRTFTTNSNIPITEVIQTFSIIPLKAGNLTLPAIRIPWWNLKTNQTVWAELPAKTINIIENQYIVNSNITTPTATEKAVKVVSQNVTLSLSQHGLLIFSLCALFIALVRSWLLRRPKRMITITKTPTLSYKAFKAQLNATTTLEETIILIQTWATIHWQLPENSTLQHISLYVMQNYENSNIIIKLLKQLDATLYGQQKIVLAEWQHQFMDALKQIQLKQNNSINITPTLASLNP